MKKSLHYRQDNEKLQNIFKLIKNEFSYATLAKLSMDISVSETTVIRFAYSLGFDSFSAMQQKLREEILSVPQRNVEGQIQNQTFYQKVFPEKRRHCKTGSHI